MKSTKGYSTFDAAEYLRDEKMIASYLNTVLKEYADDSAFITKALGTVARARGMTGVAKKAGLTRASLYKALSGDTAPEFATVLKVIHALGLKLKVV